MISPFAPAYRRPFRARNWTPIQAGAGWLTRQEIAPNHISVASVLFSALSAVCLLLLPTGRGTALWLLCVGVVFFIGGRSLCNIFDGMVAIEGGKRTKSGELFNDIPDRIADPLIIVAAGYAAGVPALGWLAGLLAVMTAYVRTLARSIGAPADFRGPMSKAPRMAAICGATILVPLESLLWHEGTLLRVALVVIAAGCVLTMWHRARAAYLYLER